jgi:hypothetical protein
MAKTYHEQEEKWRLLKEHKQIVSAEIWRIFDKLFTSKVKEIEQILKEKDFMITKSDGVIIIGLIQSAANFLNTIKTGEKNEISSTGEIWLHDNFTHLSNHCLRNDLNTINSIAELRTHFDEQITERKPQLLKAIAEMEEVINNLRQLTKE